MTIRLDHTIVPARDKVASAEFFAEIFGLTVKLGHFAQVQINESLTFDFADEPEPWGGPGFDPRAGESHHYAFHVSNVEFEAIFGRVKAKGLPYGSGPYNHTDGRICSRRGGRGFYLRGPQWPPVGSNDGARDEKGIKWPGLNRDHLVFLVSDLGEDENLQLASKLAAPVDEFLTWLKI